jgi:hypothetical protein
MTRFESEKRGKDLSESKEKRRSEKKMERGDQRVRRNEENKNKRKEKKRSDQVVERGKEWQSCLWWEEGGAGYSNGIIERKGVEEGEGMVEEGDGGRGGGY